MTIDPNMIEVNEITDYWSFLMSVSKKMIWEKIANR